MFNTMLAKPNEGYNYNTHAIQAPLPKLNDRYIIQSTLGKSKYEVKKAVDSEHNNQTVALKIFPTQMDQSSSPFYTREYLAYSKFNHSSVLKMLDSFQYYDYNLTPGMIIKCDVLVLEFAGKSDLFEYIMHTGRFSEPEARYLFKQVLEGVQHMHCRGLAHMDLKLENIFLEDDFNVKIGDLDLARPLSDIQPGSRRIGSEGYLAPEILEKKSYDTGLVDIFTLGVILFNLVVGSPPFFNASAEDPYYKYIKRGSYNHFWKIWETLSDVPKLLSPALKQLITSLLAFGPDQRPSLEQLMNSTWMQKKTISQDSWKDSMQIRYEIIEATRHLQGNY
jgi:serine/threonine protein kinase